MPASSLIQSPAHGPVPVALVGAGGYGAVHLKHLRLLEAEGRVRLVAVADPFLDRPNLAATRAELAATGVRLYADHRDLCAREPGLGLIVIVAPIPLHERMVADALATGAHIYLEKPPVPTVQQWQRLVNLDRHQRIAVGFQMLALEPLLQLRRWMETGALGRIEAITFGALWSRGTGYYTRADWAGRLVLDGEPVFDGPANNALAHIVNNVMFLAAAGTPATTAQPARVAGEFYRARAAIESYDLASLSGEFADGVRFAGVLGHCTVEGFNYEIRVRGERGSAWLGDDGRWLGSDCGLPEDRDPQAADRAIADHYRATVAWAAGVRPAPVCSLRDTGPYLRTLNAALVSSGQIHDIPSVRVSPPGNDLEYVAVVPGLASYVTRVLREALPLSSFDLAWARPGRPLDPATISFLRLENHLASDPAPAARA